MATGSQEAAAEARIARLESDVGHIRSDITEMKSDIRSLRDKIDGVSSKIESVNLGLNGKIDAMNVDWHDSLASAKIWVLVFYIALAGSLLATLARGFGWV